ncbi:MAG: methionine--tRNA ligase [Patescibacteria group bacterium]
MDPKKTFYVTTPIYYVNDVPHIGHFYTNVAADALARYHRLCGQDVMFLTGTDENSQKNVKAAEKLGRTDIQNYIDEMSAKWRETWKSLDITNDDFIRTTEERHKKAVEKFWNAVYAKGDIYQSDYEGYYCTGCEAFVLEFELVNGKCPIHKIEPEFIKEKNWFFKLSAYREKLLEHIDAHSDFIQPQSRRNEVRSYVEKFMSDVSISRESVKWGIPVPNDPKNVIYVWFDALINYISGVGYGTDEATFNKWWPVDVHLVGKDIIKFHCALWPAMLMSADLELPKTVFAHGFFTVNGDKMSKSLGNVVDPKEICSKYGIDPVRYFLLREITFGGDGNFSLDRLAERYAGDLGNEFGNLVLRVTSMLQKYSDGVVSEKTTNEINEAWSSYHKAFKELRFDIALDVIWKLIRETNQSIDTNKPWALAKEGKTNELDSLLYTWLETLRHVAWMIRPIMPDASDKILLQLKQDLNQSFEQCSFWGSLEPGLEINVSDPLFPRIENA